MNSFKGIFDPAALLEKFKTTGEGVKVAILDTGIDLANPLLAARVVAKRDLCNPAKGTGQDTDGHGTLLAGIIHSVAPSCDLLIGKIMLRSGFYTQDAFADGVRWAVRNGAELICMASGDRSYDRETDEVVKQALEKNVLVLAAIGNDGDRSSQAGTYPARCGECIAVGAVDDAQRITGFCDVNPNVQMICAPGVDVESYDLKGNIVPNSGTSQSAAYVTGILALLLGAMKTSDRQISTLKIKEALFTTALIKTQGDLSYKVIQPEILFKSLL